MSSFLIPDPENTITNRELTAKFKSPDLDTSFSSRKAELLFP